MKKEDLKVGMVFISSQDPIYQYGLLGLYEDFVVIEAITFKPSKRNKRILYSYAEFLETFTGYIRDMIPEEKEKYLVIDPDPVKEMEPGLYLVNKDVFKAVEGNFACSCGEAIQMIGIDIEKIQLRGYLWEMEIKFFKFRDTDEHTLSFSGNTKLELINCFRDTFKRMHTEYTWSLRNE